MSDADDIAWPPPEPRPGGLNRPKRALAASVELVLAAAAVLGAFLVWPHTSSAITTMLDNGVQLTSTRLSGPLVAAAIGLGAVAAVLGVDVVRQLLLAKRVRTR